MDRRKALKKISLTFGGVLASSTVLSILYSCNDKPINWAPDFLNKEQIHIIDNLVDIILPKTNTPGGKELNLTQFIDKIIVQTETKDAQNIFNLGSQEFSKVYKSTFKKETIIGTQHHFNELLNVYFNISDTKQKAVFNLLSQDLIDISVNKKKTYLVYKFLTEIRRFSLLGYYTSQEIMEGVQDYVSIPGFYDGCVDLENN